MPTDSQTPPRFTFSPQYARLALGLTGVTMIAAVGWDIRHDHLLLRLGGDFQLTRHEWGLLLREIATYVAATLGATALLAAYLRRRFQTPFLPGWSRLAGAFAVGWLNVLYFFGRVFVVNIPLVQLVWIATAALAVGVSIYRFALLIQRSLWRVQPPAATGPIRIVDISAEQWRELALILIAGYIALFATLTILRHDAFGTDLHDMGLYEQTVWNTVHGQPFRCTIRQLTPGPDVLAGYNLKQFNYNILAEHFMPALLLVAPFYANWQDPRMLCLLQTLALGLAAFWLYRAAARMLASRALAWLFLLSFLMNPLVQQANIKDFHIETFQPLFFFLAAAAIVENRLWLYWPALLLFLACSETVAAVVMLLGLFLAVRERRGRLGLATFAAGGIWYGAAVYGVMQHLRGGVPLETFYAFRELVPQGQGHSLAGLLPALAASPMGVTAILLDGARLASLLRLLLPVAAMPLLAPSALVFVLPPVAMALLSGHGQRYALELHYAMPILGPLYLAALCGARNFLHPERSRRPYLLDLAQDAAAHPEFGFPRRIPRGAQLAVAVLLAVGLLGYRFGWTPGGGRFHWDDYTQFEHHNLAKRYLAAVPEDAGVSAQAPVGAHLAARPRIFLLPEIQDGVTWLFIDTRDHYWPFVSREAFERFVRQLLEGGRWGVAREYEDGFLLLQKGADCSRNAHVLSQLNFVPYRK